MEKSFNFTSLVCKNTDLMNLFEESKYDKLELYIKINEKIIYIQFKIDVEEGISDNEYIIDNEKYYTYLDFIKYAEKNILVNEEIEVLEVNNDGPHYHRVFSDYYAIDRGTVVHSFETKEITNNDDTALIQVFARPAHTWVVLENLFYLAVIVFAALFGFNSISQIGAQVYNVGLLAIAAVLGLYCFKDYLKFKVSLYNNKIVFPKLKTNEFNLNIKKFDEIKYQEINMISYVNNPRTGKKGKELVIITKEGGQRIINLNLMSKNQYHNVIEKLIELVEEYNK